MDSDVVFPRQRNKPVIVMDTPLSCRVRASGDDNRRQTAGSKQEDVPAPADKTGFNGETELIRVPALARDKLRPLTLSILRAGNGASAENKYRYLPL